MAIFTISYDLVNKSGKQDYKQLLAELQKQKCFRLQSTVWLGAFSNNATQVHNHFKSFLGEGDRLIVAELFQHFAYSGVPRGANKWLELNKPTALPDGGPAAKQAKPAAAKKPADKAAPAKKAPAKKAPAKKAPAKAAK